MQSTKYWVVLKIGTLPGDDECPRMRSATFPQAPSHWHVHTARPSSNMVLKFPAPKRYLVRMSERRNREEAINLVWMRCGDLRTHDHEPLARALQAASPLPFFCLDDVQLGPSPEKGQLGLPSIGPYRLVALLRAVADVRSSLRGSGINLICTSGKTEDCVRKLVTLVDGPAEIRPTHITLSYYADSGLADPIEKQIEDRVVKAFEDACSGMGLSYQIQPSWGATMHHPEDILSILHGSPRTFSGDPCSLESLNSISSMTEFARLVSSVPVRKPCKDLISPPPRNDQHAHAEQLGLRSLFAHDDDEMDGDAGCNMVQSARQIISCSRLPDVQKAHRRLSELVGFDIVQHLSDSMEPSVPVTETEARGALEALECLDDYKESRTLAWGNRVGAKLSACLSLGTLSPRTVYWGIVQKYFNSGASIQELHRFPPAASDPGHAWLLFHIKCIRDYFIFSSMIDVQGEFFDAPSKGDNDHASLACNALYTFLNVELINLCCRLGGCQGTTWLLST